MQRVKHQPVRNKIDLTNASQVRAWTKRLDISADELRAMVNKVGDSVATVTKQIELQRTAHLLSPSPTGDKPEFSPL
jgi:hypothetical protein